MRSSTLYKVLAALMVPMAAALLVTNVTTVGTLSLPLGAQVPSGVVAGFGIGVVAAIMGVAGGELLIPTIVLLFAVDIKTAGSLSLLVSLPTLLVAYGRYSRDGSFAVLGAILPTDEHSPPAWRRSRERSGRTAGPPAAPGRRPATRPPRTPSRAGSRSPPEVVVVGLPVRQLRGEAVD
jgi:hypothetical protein